MTSNHLLEGRKLGKSFAGVSVLSQVDLTLQAGEVHAIVGENGAGKSTLAKLFGGVYEASEGQILLSGTEVSFTNPKQALAAGVALIHQEPLVFENLTIGENVFVGNQPGGMLNRGVSWSKMARSTVDLFRSLDKDVDPGRLASGMGVADQQMVELASALNHNAKVILFDETTASLTPKEVEELFRVIRRLRDQGCALAMVTHRLEEVFAISDRISILRDGKKVAEVMTPDSSPSEIIRFMVGRDIDIYEIPPPPEASGHPLLEVKSLSSDAAFQSITFKLWPGEIVALAGLVGSGRTELCETLFGVRKLSGGQVVVEGRPGCPRNPREAISRGLAMVPEDRARAGLFLPFGISENIGAASLRKLSRWGWLRPKAEAKEAQSSVSALGVKAAGIFQKVRELSGGNQQKVVFGKWLLTGPRILILDEPTRGVDIGAKQTIYSTIVDLARRQNMGVLMVSSDLPEVLQLADRILVMRKGRICAEISRAQASSEAVMRAATAQLEGVA